MLWDHLSPELAQLLRSIAIKRRFRDEAVIHQRGDAKRSLSIIRSGKVRMENVGRDGTVLTTVELQPGETFGEFTLLLNLRRTHDAVAVGPTVLDQVDWLAFDRLLRDHPEFARALLTIATTRLHEALEALDNVARLPLSVRLAKLVLRLADQSQDGVVRQSQASMAAALWVSRVSLGKALTALKAAGLMQTGYSEVRIADRDRLHLWIKSQASLADVHKCT